jgi:hypothetical protein
VVEDGGAQAAALVVRKRRHVDDVEVPAAVADDAAHGDGVAGRLVHDVAGRPGAIDARAGLVLGLGREARAATQRDVVLDRRWGGDEAVPGGGRHFRGC